MATSVTIREKKDFIRWFLKKHKTKRRECVWILNYLLSHEHLLENVHFTDEAHYCPRAMVISTTGSESIPFRYYRGASMGMTADAEKAFHDLRLKPEEKMYIQLNYPNKLSCTEYAIVGEENSHIPSHLRANKDDEKIAEEFLNQMSKNMNKSFLLEKIDEALDANNKELFMELTDKLIKL